MGIHTEWVLLAQITYVHDQDADLDFSLAENADFVTQLFGLGAASPVGYGEECCSRIDCRLGVYDLDDDGSIEPGGDFSLFSDCWLLCSDDLPTWDDYNCSAADVTQNDCVGPG